MSESNTTTAELRACRKCLESKPIDQFETCRGRSTHRCRLCANIFKKEWADANRVRVRQQKKAYEDRYPERVIESKVKNYRIKGKEYKRRTQEWREKNRDIRNAYEREVYRRNPEIARTRNKRRDDRQAAAGGVFTKDHERSIFTAQSGRCATPQCGADLSMTKYHADHIVPVVKGGSSDPSNRQLLCQRCNHLKQDLMPDEWARKAEIVFAKKAEIA